MKKKYIHLEDIEKAIEKDFSFLESLESDVENIRKRIHHLHCLAKYIYEDGLCPFTSKELLENDIKLQEFVMPLIIREDIIDRDNNIQDRIREYYLENEKLFSSKKDIQKEEISKDNIGQLLEDFIKFCVELKNGKKFGVGNYHIQKYLDCREFV